MNTKQVVLAGIETAAFEVCEGLWAISALAHPCIFESGGELPPNPALAKVVKAEMAETTFGKVGKATLVVAEPLPDPAALAALTKFREEYPDVKVVSSMLSISAFRGALPGLVVGPVVTPETCRSAPADKRCYRDRLSC